MSHRKANFVAIHVPYKDANRYISRVTIQARRPKQYETRQLTGHLSKIVGDLFTLQPTASSHICSDGSRQPLQITTAQLGKTSCFPCSSARVRPQQCENISNQSICQRQGIKVRVRVAVQRQRRGGWSEKESVAKEEEEEEGGLGGGGGNDHDGGDYCSGDAHVDEKEKAGNADRVAEVKTNEAGVLFYFEEMQQLIYFVVKVEAMIS